MQANRLTRLQAVIVLTGLFSCTLHAAQLEETAQELPQTTELNSQSSQMRALAESVSSDTVGQVDDTAETQALHALAPYAENTAGMCEVVNGILGDFCSANPDDLSCQAIQQ